MLASKQCELNVEHKHVKAGRSDVKGKATRSVRVGKKNKMVEYESEDGGHPAAYSVAESDGEEDELAEDEEVKVKVKRGRGSRTPVGKRLRSAKAVGASPAKKQKTSGAPTGEKTTTDVAQLCQIFRMAISRIQEQVDLGRQDGAVSRTVARTVSHLLADMTDAVDYYGV